VNVHWASSENRKISHGIRVRADCVRRVNKKIVLLLVCKLSRVAAVVANFPYHVIRTKERSECIAWKLKYSFVPFDFAHIIRQDMLESSSCSDLSVNALLPAMMLIRIHEALSIYCHI
jgi:hypothetical protein